MTVAARLLTPDDADAIQDLLEASPGYTRRVDGRAVAPDDGREILTALPPGLDPAGKAVLGLEDGGQLFALCDVLSHWPDPGIAHIGLLLVREGRQGEGLGRAMHEAVLAHLAPDRALTRLRAGIVAGNAEVAEPFWRRLGYRPMGEVKPYESGEARSTVAIWTRALDGQPPPPRPA